jgi:precorrin-6x reductase
VIVTKESGRAGGLDAKLAAARRENCRVIILRRPETPVSSPTFDHPEALISALQALVSAPSLRSRVLPESSGLRN